MSSELVRSFHGQAYKRASQHFPNVSLHFILATAGISIAGLTIRESGILYIQHSSSICPQKEARLTIVACPARGE